MEERQRTLKKAAVSENAADMGRGEAQMEQEKQYQLWLANIPGFGTKTNQKLLKEFGSARDIYFASESRLKSLLKAGQAEHLSASKQNWDIITEYEKLAGRGIKFTCYGDTDYPGRLLNIPAPPYLLYYQGYLPSDEKASAAVIGARACSEYGRAAARQFGSKLAAAGIQIISGLAMGIDGISQEAALAAGGESFGVLGNGVDICYPKSNRYLYEQLKRQGGVLSEYPPGTEPSARLFPPRNRIISALSDVVLVVEAREKSGTLITVDMALEQGREVFALPGRVTDELSKGCNKLLRQGAGVATCPEDILEALCGVGRGAGSIWADISSARSPVIIEETASAPREKAAACAASALSPKEAQVFSALSPLSKTPEEVYADLRGALPIQEVMETLVELCLCGRACQEAEGGFRVR